MAKHALISPSAFHRIGYCPASVVLSRNTPDVSSEFAEEGTRAHRMAELALQLRARTPEEDAEWLELIKDDEMREAVAQYVSQIRAFKPETLDFFKIECRLPLEPVTTEKDAFGTADCLLIEGKTLHVFDLKYGKGVRVSAQANPQLNNYALAALAEHDPDGLWYGIDSVKLHIVQPRMENYSEAEYPRETLEEQLSVIAHSAKRALYLYEHPKDIRVGHPFLCKDGAKGDFATPNEDICRFCKAKAKCPVLASQVAETVDADFEVLDKTDPVGPAELTVPSDPQRLAKAWRYLPVIRMWCDAVEASVYSRMQAGETIEGYKLVAGRAGPRKWSDAKAAEEIVRKALTVAQAYDRKVISPTTAEKYHKSGEIGPKHWAQLEALITRAEGKPIVVADSDPRPSLVAQVEKDFEVITE